MASERFLILGANGQVGSALTRRLADREHVFAFGRDEADLLRPAALRKAVRDVAPTVSLNAAAYTAVDRAEEEAELAHAINAAAPAVLAEEADALGAALVHYSSDYVFDGSGTAPHSETDPTGPQSVYGRTKLAGEQAAAAARKHLIFRTSWVYAASGSNFLTTILRLAGERERLTIVDDQVGAPTSADRIAEIAVRALDAATARADLWGLYQLAAGGETSWHGYAHYIVEGARARGISLMTTPDKVLPIPTANYPTPARRPLNSRLDTSRLRAAFGLSLPDWRVDVDRALDDVAAQRKALAA